MRALPPLFAGARRLDALLLPLAAIAQAGALGAAAFATRAAFGALHGGAAPSGNVIATLIGAGIGAAVMELFARRRAEALGQSYASALRRRLYEHLAGLSRRDLGGRRLGALSLRFVGDLSAARNWVGRGLAHVISAAFVLPGAALVLWLLDPALARAALWPMAATAGAMIVLAAGLVARHRRLRRRRSSIAVSAMERIALAPELDLMGRTAQELDRLDTAGTELRRRATDRATLSGLMRLLPQAGAALAGAMMLWRAAGAGVTPGTVAAGLSVLAILALPLRQLADSADRYASWRVARARALALLEMESAPRESLHVGAPVGVRLTGVRVAGARIDARIPPGALARITGPTGAGKSCLAALIAGLDRPTAGVIAYDAPASGLPHIAHVGALPVILQGSLRRTLTLGLRPRPGQHACREALEAFGLAALAARLGGLRGRLGEGGRTLSEGEALRLALARTALAEPDLVVIDCARLHADPEGPVLISALRGRTAATLVITEPDGDAAGLTLDTGQAVRGDAGRAPAEGARPPGCAA